MEALVFVNNALRGFGLRDQIKIISSGGIISGFDILKRMAIGADMVNSARAMMLSLGCIQALRCNANICPSGVATQDPYLAAGLVVRDKRVRVANFHKNTLKSVADLTGAMGLKSPADVLP